MSVDWGYTRHAGECIPALLVGEINIGFPVNVEEDLNHRGVATRHSRHQRSAYKAQGKRDEGCTAVRKRKRLAPRPRHQSVDTFSPS